jgi:hypothetical protein
VHHILVSGCLRQSTKHPKKPALCGLSCFWLSIPTSPYNSRRVCPRVCFEIPITGGIQEVKRSEIKRRPLADTLFIDEEGQVDQVSAAKATDVLWQASQRTR